MEILFDFKSLGWEACMRCAAMTFTTLSLGEIKRKNHLIYLLYLFLYEAHMGKESQFCQFSYEVPLHYEYV